MTDMMTVTELLRRSVRFHDIGLWLSMNACCSLLVDLVRILKVDNDQQTEAAIDLNSENASFV